MLARLTWPDACRRPMSTIALVALVAIASWAAAREDVTANQTLPQLTLDGDLLQLDGAPLTQVENGSVWLPVFYSIEDDVTITDSDGDVVADLVVAGFHRDLIMNTAITSSKRSP